MIKVTVQMCDDEAMKRFLNCLRNEKDIVVTDSIILRSVARETSRAITFMNKVVATMPDILITDVRAVRESAAWDLQMVLDYVKKCTSTRGIVIADRFHEQNVIAMMKGKARGFLSRDYSEADMIKTIRVVARGEIWLSATLITRVCDELLRESEKKLLPKQPTSLQLARMKSISRRETEILQLVSESMTNEEIAQKLYLSPKTVKTHIRNIFEKTGIRNRVEAALLYARESAAVQ